MTPSLTRRLLLASALVLAGFLGATGLALDQAFRNSLDTSRELRMEALLFTLLAAASLEDEGLTVEPPLADARLRTLESGLYARILDPDGTVLWESDSLTGMRWNGDGALPPGEQRWGQARIAGEAAMVLSYGLEWDDPAVGTGQFTVQLAESQTTRQAELHAYRRGLWGWLIAAAAALLLTQGLIQRWGLSPLHRVTSELDAIRRGRAERLSGDYPHELEPLTQSLNRLLDAERERGSRYRQALADLAHSLKTPLAVLRSRLETDPDYPAPQEALDQIERMDGSVQYHLGRASRAGHSGLAQSTPAAPVIHRLLRALPLSGERTVDVEVRCGDEVRFPGPEADLMELLGNLLDNAAKWAGSRLRITAEHPSADSLSMSVEDDGPGISTALSEQVLERGVRADQSRPGQGIGLAVVRDLVNDYGGDITIDRSELGGARLRIRLPLQAGTLRQ